MFVALARYLLWHPHQLYDPLHPAPTPSIQSIIVFLQCTRHPAVQNQSPRFIDDWAVAPLDQWT